MFPAYFEKNIPSGHVRSLSNDVINRTPSSTSMGILESGRGMQVSNGKVNVTVKSYIRSRSHRGHFRSPEVIYYHVHITSVLEGVLFMTS